MKQIEDIFLSQLDSEKEAIAEGVDLLSVFDQYFEEDETPKPQDILNSYQGFLRFSPKQIEENVSKISRSLDSTSGLEKLKKITKQINNYKNIEDIFDKISIFLITMYVYGIQKNFSAQTAGTLFEHFIAGVSGGEAVGGAGKLTDVIIDGQSWAIKLLSPKTQITGAFENFKNLQDDGKNIGLIIGIKVANGIEIAFVNPEKFTVLLSNEHEENETKEKKETQFSISQTKIKELLEDKIVIQTEELLTYFEKEVLGSATNIMKLSTNIVAGVTDYVSVFKSGKNSSQVKTITNDMIQNSKQLSKETKKLTS